MAEKKKVKPNIYYVGNRKYKGLDAVPEKQKHQFTGKSKKPESKPVSSGAKP